MAENILEGTYANFFDLGDTKYDVQLIFAEIVGENKIMPRAKIIVSQRLLSEIYQRLHDRFTPPPPQALPPPADAAPVEIENVDTNDA